MSTKTIATEGTCVSAASSSTCGVSVNSPTARRLRTRTSTGGNMGSGDSGKKSGGCSNAPDRNTNSSDFNKNDCATNSTGTGASATGINYSEDKQSTNHCSGTNSITGSAKKYHNSCPHPMNDRGRGKPAAHLQPHSSSTFNLNKTEEFHFDTPVECPVFRPTQEEFKNPLAYINKIRPIAEKCGIAKILPPESWSPPFAVDVDKLKFTPRVQRLNELEAKTRVKLNFLDQIAKFWELQGSSLKIPMVERKALDLYTLHRIVQEEGGMEQTTKERKWAKVANRMSYPSSKSVGATLKAHYERILHPFEVYTSGKVLGGGIGAATSVDAVKLEDGTDYKAHEIPTRQQIAPPNENNARRSKRFANSSANCGLGSASRNNMKVETKEDFNRDLLHCFNAAGTSTSVIEVRSQASGTALANATAQKKAPDPQIVDPLLKYICHICNRGDVEESMLLCDGCDDSYHTFCLLPPLSSIPKGEWLCPRCVVEEVSKPTEAFGFEQAEREYTLQQFGQMADQFKMDYFRKPVHLVPTHLVEREFWRIVSSIDEDVTVEYGADLHTMDHGSGFPTKSSLYLLPGDQEYAESSWNLNNLPLLEDSILGHINADISGMNAPWMYVGMCFAAFCWHNEDHWSYSINYLHWGEPKTWYGVPGFWAEQFEETMKQAAPELFASQPDLLHQLVTIMNPNILMNNGVPVYRTDQNAGEFVITFPRAYHAGFNQGYNFAEAVNFAPADWLKMGRECVNHYSMLRRFCVFSHDELVCKMALEPAKLTFGIATACYIDMAEMVDSEKKLRKSLLEWGVTRAERKAFELVPDDERHCHECNTTCFLSAVACECTKSIVCLRHYTVLCDCLPEKHTLLYRYTLDEMPLMLQKLKAKAQSFERWLSRCRDIVDANTPTSVPLTELQELCKEAELKKFPSSLLIDRLNSAIVEAEKCVTVIQQLGINKIISMFSQNDS
ncbi:PREDICTED: lysine-specific demethylase lid isoform X1 [Rhagoletis zephyria]|uniref:lysine-specific demethylase lid isoform X1 n=1 Tax=Rhagoletis zephyria TaxID=28612 RepID=UPI0008119482|nr:PREDICTED: lysine-specific demethylase lid isoform X1 [Rhagoletis zephyria]